MGGGSQSTTAQFPPEQARLMSLQGDVAASAAPGLQSYILSTLSGDPQRARGYAASMTAPIESATQRALQGILQRVPAGGARQQMLEETRLAGGLKRAEAEQEYTKQALSLVNNLFSQRPTPTGQTATGPGFDSTSLIGPGIAAAALVGAAAI